MKRSLSILLAFAAAALATVNYPYPQETSYPNGTYVSGISGKVKTKFQNFLSNYYEESGNLARIKFDDGSYTVSEGIGYGMLMMVYFSDNTTSYQSHFDKLWAYYNNWLNSNGLMHWKITGFSGVNQQNAATDAEEDVALALIMAYYQFGDEKYLNDAKSLVAKIRQHEFNSGDYLHRPGDVWDDYKNPSYVSPAAYELFKSVDDNSFWTKALSANYTLLKANQNSSTGLPSGWSNASGTPINGNAGYIAYDYDAPRAPWRWAMSYAWFGHSDAKTLLTKLAAWVGGKSSASKLKVPISVTDGSDVGTAWSNATAIGPLTCAMLVSDSYSSKLSSFSSALLNKGSESYFNDAMQVLSGLLLSGNMQNFAAMKAVSSSSAAKSSSSSVQSSSSAAVSSSSAAKSSSSSVQSSSSAAVSSSSAAKSSSSSVQSSSSAAASSSSAAKSSSSSVQSSSSVGESSSSQLSSSSFATVSSTEWESEKANISNETADGKGVTIGSTSDWSSERVVTKVIGNVVPGVSYTLSFNAFVQAGGGDMETGISLNSYCNETKTFASGNSEAYSCTFTATASETVTLTLTMPGSRWETVTISNLSLVSASGEEVLPSNPSEAVSPAKPVPSISATLVGRRLDIASAAPVNVSIFDMQGRLIQKISQIQGTVSLESLKSGSYVIRLHSGASRLTKRVSLK